MPSEDRVSIEEVRDWWDKHWEREIGKIRSRVAVVEPWDIRLILWALGARDRFMDWMDGKKAR